MAEKAPCENTDTHLWPLPNDDYYADTVFATKEGSIGFNVGGYAITKPIREWFKLAKDANGCLCHEPEPAKDTDLNVCPNCGGPADNGFDRCIPPNPYWCTKCEADPAYRLAAKDAQRTDPESSVDLRLKARSAAATLRDALEHRGIDDVSALVEQFGDTFRRFNRMRADQMNRECGMVPPKVHDKP